MLIFCLYQDICRLLQLYSQRNFLRNCKYIFQLPCGRRLRISHETWIMFSVTISNISTTSFFLARYLSLINRNYRSRSSFKLCSQHHMQQVLPPIVKICSIYHDFKFCIILTRTCILNRIQLMTYYLEIISYCKNFRTIGLVV